MIFSDDELDALGELLALHYDPAYTRSIDRNFPRVAGAIDVAPSALTDAAFAALAREIDARIRTLTPA